jgi:hypothetical protein
MSTAIGLEQTQAKVPVPSLINQDYFSPPITCLTHTEEDKYRSDIFTSTVRSTNKQELYSMHLLSFTIA